MNEQFHGDKSTQRKDIQTARALAKQVGEESSNG